MMGFLLFFFFLLLWYMLRSAKPGMVNCAVANNPLHKVSEMRVGDHHNGLARSMLAREDIVAGQIVRYSAFGASTARDWSDIRSHPWGVTLTSAPSCGTVKVATSGLVLTETDCGGTTTFNIGPDPGLVYKGTHTVGIVVGHSMLSNGKHYSAILLDNS